MLSRAGHRSTVVCPPSHCRYDSATKSNGSQDLAVRLLEAAEARSHSPKLKNYSFWGIGLLNHSAASTILIPSCWYSG